MVGKYDLQELFDYRIPLRIFVFLLLRFLFVCLCFNFFRARLLLLLKFVRLIAPLWLRSATTRGSSCRRLRSAASANGVRRDSFPYSLVLIPLPG